MLEKKTKLGHIRFSRNVILRIIEDAVAECNGNVALFNYKGRYKNVVPANNVSFLDDPQGVEIVVYIVIKFGAGIKENTQKIMNYIYDEVENVMGERPKSVKIVVTGIKSIEIARRHIEITE